MHKGLAGVGLVVALSTAAVVTARDRTSPDEWLERMSEAVQSMNYEGTVIRRQGGEVQPLKVVHKMIDGVVNERIVVQEGNGLEVIRIGDEAHCIVADRKTVLIEHWDNASTLFSTLPSSKVEPGPQYDVLILDRDERVAGRPAVKLAVRPNDSHRFEQRYWLDKSTGFPLRIELVDLNGDVIDQLKFADINLGADIAQQSLAPSVNLENYTWYATPMTAPPEEIEAEWTSDDLPAGFRIVAAKREVLRDTGQTVAHVVFGDGLANVSVFIAETPVEAIRQRESRGASNSFSTEVDGHQVTAVGEVPAATVEMIARSMRRQ